MFKIEELKDPNSCLNKAKDDEMLFVLLSRDEAAVDTIKYWIQKRIDLGLNGINDTKIKNATRCAEIMLQQISNKDPKHIENAIIAKELLEIKQHLPASPHSPDFIRMKKILEEASERLLNQPTKN